MFPGGVSEEADASEHWLHLLSSFGFDKNDFESLHRPGTPITPIFADNPVKRHIALRITAIRETFEELGLLICSTKHKNNRNDICAKTISDIDTKYWQERVSENPSELLNLCKEYNCYPDIWSLYYWSNWLSPLVIKRRFDTAFFVAALENKPTSIRANSEVVNVEWKTALETLEANREGKIELYSPQGYELHRFSKFSDFDKLVHFAKERSSNGDDLIYPVCLEAKDGTVYLMPEDYLYPTNVDLVNTPIIYEDKTILELRGENKILHRLETDQQNKTVLAVQNFVPKHHFNMGTEFTPLNIKNHKIK